MMPTRVYSSKRQERERLAVLARQRDRAAARVIRFAPDPSAVSMEGTAP